MPEVIKNTENFIGIGPDWIVRLKEEAKGSPNRRARLLMHQSIDDPIQEMLIAFHKNCLIPPNQSPGKSESLQVIEGELLLVIFDDRGHTTDRIEMGAVGGDKMFLYRFCSTPWHTMIPRTEFIVVHECIQGPFVESEEPVPGWVPTDPDSLNSFLQGVMK